VKRLRITGAGLLASLILLAGCTEEVPTSPDPGLIPVEAETFEVLLPFETFATAFRVDRGFGVAGDLATVFVASEWQEELTVRPLFRFLDFPATVGVIPPGATVAQPDSSYVPVGGRLVLLFDTLRVDGSAPFDLQLSTVSESWDPPTATWTHAVDTLGDRRAWSRPGGGTLTPLASAPWTPSEGDSVILQLDSLTLREWRDAGSSGQGLVLSTPSEGSRLRLRSLSLQVDVRSEVNPDTVIRVQPTSREFTTIYTPTPEFGEGVLPVGGAPSHRSSFRLQLPATVEATGPICRGAATCPVQLTADRVVYAALQLTSIPTEPAALAPADTMTLDLRPVLAEDRLPRSPLGPPLRTQGVRVAPSWFTPGGSSSFEIAVTRYLRDVLRGEDSRGDPVSGVLSFLTIPEPAALGVATFAGPGAEGRPRLRIILTVSEGVSLP
jgi:hypothetical protein